MNKENLLKMADYIETIPAEKFDMGTFRNDIYSDSPECNSVGCVIGHCTILDAKNVETNFRHSDGSIRFSDWSKSFTQLERLSDEWNYCFSGDWRQTDNTPSGAAKRIRYLAENGLPDDWFEQLQGDAPLCY